MKIGIYGGTFDPIHRGHLAAAAAAAEQLQLDQLVLIPDHVPPHKTLSASSALPQQRLDMAVLATADLPCKAEVLDLELQRQGKSYTSDTLRALHQRWPEEELWLLMGTDMFLSFHTWHEPEVIAQLASLAAFSRSADPHRREMEAQCRYLQKTYGARTVLLDNPHLVEISSTQLRQALTEGKGREYLTEPVYGYILRKGLYGTRADLRHLSREDLQAAALSCLKPKRIRHVLGTAATAVELARRYGAPEEAAWQAGILHDCTKKLELDEQLELCRRYGLELDDLQRQALKLQHAITGAAVAREVFGMSPEVVSAIRWHTTGRPEMTVLEKVIYLADYIEPSRDFPGVEQLRQTVYEDLDRGMLLGLEMTIEEMQERGSPVHQDTLRARDWFAEKEGVK